jgi:effector-binding domain-containing protein
VRKLLLASGSLIALLFVIGLALPRHGRVQAAIEIDAYPATVFALANDFRRVALWSPLTDRDPNTRIVFSGPARGVGATMTWDGVIIGSGTQVISASEPVQYVAMTLHPGEAGEAHSTMRFDGDDGTTRVTWTFSVDHGFNIVGRYLDLLRHNLVRGDYEAGLASLKELAESLPREDFSDIEIQHLHVEAIRIAYLSTRSRPEASSISQAMGEAYFEILRFIDANDLREAGAPISIMQAFSGVDLSFQAAIPISGDSPETPGDGKRVKIGATYAGPVVRVQHVGSYRTLGRTHAKITAYIAAAGIERAGAAWESYVSDPTKVDETELVTLVYYPIRQ